MKIYLLIFCLLSGTFTYSQYTPENKSINALRISNSPVIDGELNEPFWSSADIAKDFVMFKPGNGDKETFENRTEVKVVYDDEAIYFGAYLYIDDIEKLALEYSTRDNFGQVDWFGIILNPNNDGQNDTELFIQATGNQADAKSNFDNEDFNWSAVWKSAVKIGKNKWTVEVKIPYSALRFSNNEIQTWGLNFHRKIQDTREQYTWNPINKTKGNIQQYAGTLNGLKKLSPPIRLSFSPYASSAYATYDGTNKFNNNFGMDLKYGISDSFTLDATLIPDFGQTAFDDITLNLGPFEQKFSEKRAFFTEGTELFSKGNLFYSRRVGNSPSISLSNDDLEINEEIINNPTSVKMLNAIKISGRTRKGLGVGVFNAITDETFATIKNTKTNEVRKKTTEPFANYNVLVLDQQFNKNSSISLVNTNVTREGHFRNANVTTLLFELVNKVNTYKIDGAAGISYINEFHKTSTGFISEIAIRKTSGKFHYGIKHELQDNKFNKNDLGFQRRNNFSNFESYMTYQIFEPTQNFDSYKFVFWAELDYLYTPNKYTGNEIGFKYKFQTKKSKLSFGGLFETSIGNQFDYYEPRVEGRYFKKPGRIISNQWVSTDYRNQFAIDANIFYVKRVSDDNYFIKSELSPRFRVNNKLSFIYNFEYSQDTNDKGFVNLLDDDSVIFGKRDTKSFTNSISSKFNFSVKSALALTFRHYWSPVEYDSQYYLLNNKGLMIENNYNGNHDINYNIWNFDLSYSWEFAPGSQLIALYRNSIFNEDNYSDLNFEDNLENLFEEPVFHNLSLRLVYYLDYNKVKNWL